MLGIKHAVPGVVALLLWATAPSVGQDRPATPFVEATPESQSALDDGLAFLAKRQTRKGNVGNQHPIAATGLSGIAFLGNGNTPDRGLYAENVRRCVHYLAQKQQRNGYITVQGSTMYDHGFATLFLAEVYGTYPDADLKDTLQKAIRLIETSQDPSGGWVYAPSPSGQSDISITICQVMALRAARNVGVTVDEDVIDLALDCVLRAQNPDGGFSYRIGSNNWGGGSSAYPRSAAGCCILYNLGQYDHPATQKALNYLETHREDSGYYFYARYYASQAMFQAGGERWQRFWPRVRQELTSSQGSDGSWTQGVGGPAVSTAMGCIILSIPNRYLPIFER